MPFASPRVIADDDAVSIVVESKQVDADGDAGYVLGIANKTSGKVYVYAAPGWKAHGDAVDDPVLRALVDPGQSVEEFMWFDRSVSFDGLKGVKGAIVVEDRDSAAIVGTYPFEA